MKTVDEDIAEIKAELLVVKENFTKIDGTMDDMNVEIMTNKMNSEEADQCLREELESDKAQTDKVRLQNFCKKYILCLNYILFSKSQYFLFVIK